MRSRDSSSAAVGDGPKQRLVTFWSLGWVLLLSALLCGYGVYWNFAQRRKMAGDGLHAASYGFDLTTTLVPREQIIAAGLRKDGLRAFVNPRMLSATEWDEANRAAHGKLLVPDDLVVGLEASGEARAYPLRILTLHEIANDTIGTGAGAVYVAVTYNALCDSVVVVDREVGGKVLEFGVSGLLYNSNLLLYDREANGTEESLWAQLQWRAVAGPAAARGETLQLLPFRLMRWSEWRKRHPDTLVLAGEPELRSEYAADRYSTYFGTDALKFPVQPAWDENVLPNKTRVAAVRLPDGWRVYLLPKLARLSGADLAAALETGDAGFRLEFDPVGQTLNAVPTAAGVRPEVVDAFLFAWYADHPGEMPLVPR